MSDVAIVGIGIHPFGRHEGVTGRAQGAAAARDPLRDAGVCYGLGEWYGETGLMVTTQFFAMKIRRYLHDNDIDPHVLSVIAARHTATALSTRTRGAVRQCRGGDRVVDDGE
jgi:hypothetical protein